MPRCTGWNIRPDCSFGNIISASTRDNDNAEESFPGRRYSRG